MLKQKKAYTAQGGFGDLFMVLPLVEKMGPINFVLGSYFDQQGIPELLKILLPEAKVSFESSHYKYPSVHHFDHYFTKNARRPDCDGRICLPDRIIRQLKPDPAAKEKIIIHPVSGGLERRYPHFKAVDLSGLPYQIVGYSGETGGLSGEVFKGDFVDVSRLLLGSKGLLCVDSCVMHLANLLSVPSVAIFHNYINQQFIPNYGPGLVNPSPEEVSEYVKKLFNGEFQNFWSKRPLIREFRNRICSKS